ncbi:hypothetical protein FRC04_007348 [Tulasnella sp. 424]|nr:hypothetical protein FRC04_007348 [Tulasnella sp. 424]
MDQYKSFDAQHGGDVNQGAAPLFPPLAAFYNQESLAFGPTIMLTWGAVTTAGSGAFDPQTGGNNYDYVQAAAETAIEASVYNHHLRQFQMDDRASNNVQPFLCPRGSRITLLQTRLQTSLAIISIFSKFLNSPFLPTWHNLPVHPPRPPQSTLGPDIP